MHDAPAARDSAADAPAATRRAPPSPARSSIFERCHRSVQPRTCRSTKPAGLPRCSRPFASRSMPWSCRQRIDQRRADAPALVGSIGQLRRLVGADHEPAPPLHHVERARRRRSCRRRTDTAAAPAETPDASPPASDARASCRARSAATGRAAGAAARARRRRSERGTSGSSGRRGTARPPSPARDRGRECSARRQMLAKIGGDARPVELLGRAHRSRVAETRAHHIRCPRLDLPS